jgi:hypothetical protein
MRTKGGNTPKGVVKLTMSTRNKQKNQMEDGRL